MFNQNISPVPWSSLFDDPIKPPKGRPIMTLKDAAAYIMRLPATQQQSPEWQAAGEALLMAAEDRGPLMHAHVGMMLALHGAKPIPVARSAKTHWGKRKLKRGRMTRIGIAGQDTHWRATSKTSLDGRGTLSLSETYGAVVIAAHPVHFQGVCSCTRP
jgi:hypothetical protein